MSFYEIVLFSIHSTDLYNHGGAILQHKVWNDLNFARETVPCIFRAKIEISVISLPWYSWDNVLICPSLIQQFARTSSDSKLRCKASWIFITPWSWIEASKPWIPRLEIGGFSICTSVFHRVDRKEEREMNKKMSKRF